MCTAERNFTSSLTEKKIWDPSGIHCFSVVTVIQKQTHPLEFVIMVATNIQGVITARDGPETQRWVQVICHESSVGEDVVRLWKNMNLPGFFLVSGNKPGSWYIRSATLLRQLTFHPCCDLFTCNCLVLFVRKPHRQQIKENERQVAFSGQFF